MPGQRKPELNVTGLVAGAAATVSSTVAASYFGVGGTLIGAGVMSVLSTVGATYYQHVLDRGKAQIAAKIPVRVSAGGVEAEGGEAGCERTGRSRRRRLGTSRRGRPRRRRPGRGIFRAYGRSYARSYGRPSLAEVVRPRRRGGRGLPRRDGAGHDLRAGHRQAAGQHRPGQGRPRYLGRPGPHGRPARPAAETLRRRDPGRHPDALGAADRGAHAPDHTDPSGERTVPAGTRAGAASVDLGGSSRPGGHPVARTAAATTTARRRGPQTHRPLRDSAAAHSRCVLLALSRHP